MDVVPPHSEERRIPCSYDRNNRYPLDPGLHLATIEAVKIETSDYVTLANAARLAGCTREYMRRLAQAANSVVGGLEIDGHWFVKRTLAERLEVHPTKGKPGTRKRK